MTNQSTAPRHVATCSGCGQSLGLPAGRGVLQYRCPACGHQGRADTGASQGHATSRPASAPPAAYGATSGQGDGSSWPLLLGGLAGVAAGVVLAASGALWSDLDVGPMLGYLLAGGLLAMMLAGVTLNPLHDRWERSRPRLANLCMAGIFCLLAMAVTAPVYGWALGGRDGYDTPWRLLANAAPESWQARLQAVADAQLVRREPAVVAAELPVAKPLPAATKAQDRPDKASAVVASRPARVIRVVEGEGILPEETSGMLAALATMEARLAHGCGAQPAEGSEALDLSGGSRSDVSRAKRVNARIREWTDCRKQALTSLRGTYNVASEVFNTESHRLPDTRLRLDAAKARIGQDREDIEQSIGIHNANVAQINRLQDELHNESRVQRRASGSAGDRVTRVQRPTAADEFYSRMSSHAAQRMHAEAQAQAMYPSWNIGPVLTCERWQNGRTVPCDEYVPDPEPVHSPPPPAPEPAPARKPSTSHVSDCSETSCVR